VAVKPTGSTDPCLKSFYYAYTVTPAATLTNVHVALATLTTNAAGANINIEWAKDHADAKTLSAQLPDYKIKLELRKASDGTLYTPGSGLAYTELTVKYKATGCDTSGVVTAAGGGTVGQYWYYNDSPALTIPWAW